MTSEVLHRSRGMFFVPASKLALVDKIPRRDPVLVVVDLENGIGMADKERARAAIVASDLCRDGLMLLVWLNPEGIRWFDQDIEAVRRSGAAGAVVPKTEIPDVLDHLGSRLSQDIDSPVIVAGIECAVGAANVRAILGAVPSGTYFGAENYIADLGGRRTPEGMEVLYARSEVAFAGRFFGVQVIDQLIVRFDDEAFRCDGAQGRDLGYAGKICIHPRQVVLSHEVFTPTAREVREALAVIDATRAGLGVVNGQMADEVHIHLPRQVLGRAGMGILVPNEESA